MATYEIETPDGAVYEIDAADEAQLQATIAQLTSGAPTKKPVSAKDRFIAASAGGYSGIASLAGLPVDSVLNAWDLGKAGIGTAQGLITGKAPSPAFGPSERGGYVGSSEWIKRQLMNKAGAITEVPRPDDTASNVIKGVSEFGTGMFLGSALPSPKTQPPLRPAEGWVAPGYASSRANANVNIGPSSAGAQATMSGNLGARASGGGYNFGSVGDDAATGLSRGQRTAAENFPQGRLTPGQATGNKLLQRLEAKLESQPMTAGPFDRIKDSNLREINRAAARAIGEETDELTADVLDRAVTRMSSVFDDVRDDVPRVIDPQDYAARMQSVLDEFEAIGPQVANHPLVARFIRHGESGQATGKDLGNLTSKLSREVHRQMTSPQGDRELGMALGRVKDYVDDLVEQGLSGDRLRAYQEARGQYRNLSLLTSRVGAINPSTGNVNGSVLANLLQQKDKSGFLFGRNDSEMYNAAKFAQAFRPLVGDSGTATRMPLPSPTDFVLSLPFNLATRAYTSSPSVQVALSAQAAARGTGALLRRQDLPQSGLLGAITQIDD